MRVHATALELGGKGVLIRGPSGCGKSDLALRCLAVAPSDLITWPARLVCDDQVELRAGPAGLHIEAIDAIYGKLEVRGLGIVEITALTRAVALCLVVDVAACRDEVERMPEPTHTLVMGVRVPRLTLYPFDASSAVKLLLALLAVS